MSHRKIKTKTKCKLAHSSKINRTMRTYKRITNTKPNKNKKGGYLHNPGVGVVVGGLLGSS